MREATLTPVDERSGACDPLKVCERLEACGSCPLLPLPYEAQLAQKQAHLRAQLAPLAERFGWPLDDLLAPPMAAPSPLGYRHSVKLVAQPASRGRVRLGLYRPGTHEVIDTRGCPVQSPSLNALLDALRALLREPSAPPLYDEASRSGALRYVVARASWGAHASDPQLHLTLISAHPELTSLAWLAEQLSARCPELIGVAAHYNPSEGNAIFDWSSEPLMRPLMGEGALTSRFKLLEGEGSEGESSEGERLGGALTLRASAESFSQVNPAAASLAYRAVVEALAPQRGERALDLYCGVGSLALSLAQRGCEGVVGLEESPSSVADARYNATLNGLEATFEEGLTEQTLPAWVSRWREELPLSVGLKGAREGAKRRPVVVSLNPSRRGCQPEVLEQLAQLSPRRVAYMSCHPRSLMRDLKRLAKLGYTPERLQLFDLFPGTPHYEVVCALS